MTVAELADRILTHGHMELEMCDALVASLAANPDSCSFSWHPLGFIHGTVLSLESSTLRVHIWPRGRRRAQNPFWRIHTHVFDLESTVIHGCIENELYSVSDEQFSDEALYKVRYKDSESVLVATEQRVRSTLCSSQRLSRGECYELPAGEFHFSHVEEGCGTVSVVRARTTDRVQALVVGETAGHSQYRYVRSLCEDPQSYLLDIVEAE